MTASTIVSTCLTFAATVIVNADVFLFACKRVNGRAVRQSRYFHIDNARQPIRLELTDRKADHVQEERNDTIHQQSKQASVRHLPHCEFLYFG